MSAHTASIRSVGSTLQFSPVESLFAVFEWVLTNVYGAGMNLLADLLGIQMLGYPYMQRAYLAAVCIGVIGPLVGTFLVHRELSMLSDTLAHTAFAGVAVGLFLNATFSLSLSPLATAFVVAVGTALLVELLVDYAGAYSDTSLAIVLTGGFAVGSVLITATDGGIAVGINAYLFGSLATVSRLNAALLVALSAVVTVGIALAYRPLVYITFDEIGARASGIGVKRYNQLLAVLTAVVVVGAMQIMGVILVAAMLVVPVAAATPVRGFKRSIAAAVGIAQAATIAGVSLSYAYDVAAGGTIVLVAIGLYAASELGVRLRRRAVTRASAADESEQAAPAADGGRE